MPSASEASEPAEAAEAAEASEASGPHRKVAGGQAKRPKRLAVRTRLALTLALLVTLAGLTLMAVVTVYFGLVPNYSFANDAGAMPVGSEGLTIELAPGITPPSGSALPDIAVTVSSRGDMLRLLLIVSGGAVIILAALGGGVGWVLAGRMLRPLQEVNAAARRAAAGHFDHRVAHVGPRDEIAELADTFDEMLGEIEKSVDAHRRFVANASHELRTPLTTSKVMLDVALAVPRTGERELLERLRETNLRSINTVESLLDLAEIEVVTTAREPVDLAALVAEVVAECSDEAKSAELGISVESAHAVVEVDPMLIRQLITNLLQNAIRHNVPGGQIVVRTWPAETQAAIAISNTGQPLGDAEVALLCEPFHRGRGRTSIAATRGRGLGLSIVRAIVDQHDGALDISANPGGGLSVTVLLPRTP